MGTHHQIKSFFRFGPALVGLFSVSPCLCGKSSLFLDKISAQVHYMPPSLEDILLTVWRQSMVEHATSVKLNDNTYPVKTTKGRGLKQVDFAFGERSLRGLEQNPATKSRWAAMAREGKNVMQFLENGTYVAVVVDGKIHTYGTLRRKALS
jgi:hypothetical protein